MMNSKTICFKYMMRVFIPKFVEFQFGYLRGNTTRLNTPLYGNIVRSVKKYGLMERLGLSESQEENRMKRSKGVDFEKLVGAGMKIEEGAWKQLKEIYRGVDFGNLVEVAIAEDGEKKIENVAGWLAERAKGIKARKEAAGESEFRKGLRELYRRRAGTEWSGKEEKALREVEGREGIEDELGITSRHTRR